MQKKLVQFAANITLGGSLIFLFFYSLIVTIALIVFISQSNDTPEQIQHVQQINKLIDSQGVK